MTEEMHVNLAKTLSRVYSTQGTIRRHLRMRLAGREKVSQLKYNLITQLTLRFQCPVTCNDFTIMSDSSKLCVLNGSFTAK